MFQFKWIFEILFLWDFISWVIISSEEGNRLFLAPAVKNESSCINQLSVSSVEKKVANTWHNT